MRRATTFGSFCSQIAFVLVIYLYLFRRNLLLKCAPHPEIAKTLTPPIVLVMISSMSVPICNRFHASQANSD